MHLKPLSVDAIPSALVNAERYRFLNEPGEAESICLDVLAVDPANQAARVMLILALTDQLLDDPGALPKARALAAELDDAYEREYYAGLVCERRARAQVARGGHGSSEVAREWLKMRSPTTTGLSCCAHPATTMRSCGGTRACA
jgi:hypothetical protein